MLHDRHKQKVRRDRVQHAQKQRVTAHPQRICEQTLMGVYHIDDRVGESKQRRPVAI